MASYLTPLEEVWSGIKNRNQWFNLRAHCEAEYYLRKLMK